MQHSPTLIAMRQQCLTLALGFFAHPVTCSSGVQDTLKAWHG